MLKLPSIALATLLFVSPALGQQTFFLDFDSGTDGSINYTTQMRNDIVAQVQTIYSAFNITVTQSLPTGTFSTITFNAGGPGGVAEQIDFRNLDKGDNAIVNVDGLGISGTANIVSASAIIGAHEGGHLLGLRHHDSIGPIGTGIAPTINPGFFAPSYPGPQNAIETNGHIMASPGATGQNINEIFTPSWLSERSAIKLTYNEEGAIGNESAAPNDTLATAQALNLEKFSVANTIVAGANAGIGDFDVDAHALTGRLDNGDVVDFYSFEGSVGDLINIELMSNNVDRLAVDAIDPTITVIDSSGTVVDYYGTNAFNDDEMEGLDSHIIDLFLPSDDTYFIRVGSFSGVDTGNYELFLTRFNGPVVIPEPASIGLVCVLGFYMISRRRRIS